MANEVLRGEFPDTDDVTLIFECERTSHIRWVVGTGTYSEKLNAPFSLRLDLETDDLDAESALLLGQPCQLVLQRGESQRVVSGIVTSVQEGSSNPQRVSARLDVVPAFEALRHRVNTRIFQEKTVPEILKEVLDEGLSTFSRTVDTRLARTYPVCEYRAQYDESDLAFCERLMEEEGISYWFEFPDSGTEVLVLSDDSSNFGQVESFSDVFDSGTLSYSGFDGQVGGHEYVGDFSVVSRLRPTKVVTRHFDWTHPSMSYEADSAASEPGAPTDGSPSGALIPPEREVYQHDDRPLTFHEYDGAAYAANDMDAQVRLRREAQAFDARVAEGESTVVGMAAAKQFELFGHPQGELDGRYLVLSVEHSFDASGTSYRNRFRCIPIDVPYRPKRETPRPRVPNIQTAMVVGPAGEEIHTDEHGRVKVQLHWDRLGQYDERSSCWLRVMQPWAGTGWGFVFIPRIGMEVMVAFANGDPDRPVVVGSLYNGDHPPPYPLPEEKTKSTIKTNSSLGGGGSNELRFEDKAGQEEVYVHAQKDFNEVVEHNHSTLVRNDQFNTVNRCQTENVLVNQNLTVGGIRIKNVGGNETTHVGGTRNETVVGDEEISLLSNRTVTVNDDDALTVKASRNMNVSDDLDENVGKNHTQKVGLVQTIAVGLAKAEEIGTTLEVKVGDSIAFTTGKSSITLKKDGDITVKGVKIILKGEEVVGVKGGKKSSLTLDKGKAKVKGPKVQVRGKGLIELKASKITEN